MASDSAMFDARRRYHPTSVLSPVPYPLSDPSAAPPPPPPPASAASLTASFLRTSPPHPSSGGGFQQSADVSDDLLAYHHAHAVPLSAAPSASLHSAGRVSSTASLSSLGSSASTQSHHPAAARPATSASASAVGSRPSDVDFELFDIFQMASSFEGAGEAGHGHSQMFQHSMPSSHDPLSPSSAPQLSPPRPSPPPRSGSASQHLQDAMLRQLAGSDQAAFFSLSPLPPPADALTPPPVVPLQPPMMMFDQATALKREMRSPSRDSARSVRSHPIGLSPLSPQHDSARHSGSSTPSSSASFQPSLPSRSSPATSAPISPYAQLPPALLQQLLTQHQHQHQHHAAAYPGPAAVSPSLSYPLSTSPAGVPLAPHSHRTLQEDEDDEDEDDDDDDIELPRAHKRTHLASPSSHVSTLLNRPAATRAAASITHASDDRERDSTSERKHASDTQLTDADEHKDATDHTTVSATSSPIAHTSRLSRKAELARASRKRKKMYVADLEEKVSKLASTVEELQKKKKNAGGLSKEERVRREQQSAIKERLTQLIAQTQLTAVAEPDGAATETAGDAGANAEVAPAADMAADTESSPTTAATTPPSSVSTATAPAFSPATSYELQELVTRFVYNCFTDDEQVLTEHGFLSVDAVTTHLQHSRTLHIACYNADTAMTEYHPIELQHVTRPPLGWQRIVRFQLLEADVDLRVTDNHDMWVRSGGSESFGKVQAGALVGAQENERDWTQLLTCAEGGAWHGAGYEWREQAFVRVLGVRSRTEHDAVLELCGYWLGCGCVQDEQQCIVLLTANSSQSRYLDKLLASLHGVLPLVLQKTHGRYHVHSPLWLKLFTYPDDRHLLRRPNDRQSEIVCSCSSPSSTSSYVSCWLLRSLDRQRLRAVVKGVTSSSRNEAAGKQAMHASSTVLRDQLQLLALHAGYTSHFTFDDPTSLWHVTYSDSAALTQPTLHTARHISAAIDQCRVWCVTVPQRHQLIWARRILNASKHGTVLSASRPVITGNSRERQGHVDYYFDRVGHCLSPGLQVRFAMWGLTQQDDFYSLPGLWQSLMEGEIGLDRAQMDWILSKREALHAERKNLQTCELMLRETRNAISMHLHSLHGHMDDLLSVMTPLQLAKFYLWVENNAWCMQMLARWS